MTFVCVDSFRWTESICGQYLSHIYGKRQARDVSRTLEIFKTVAASETNINYTVLMLLKNKTITKAMPKVCVCVCESYTWLLFKDIELHVHCIKHHNGDECAYCAGEEPHEIREEHHAPHADNVN